MNRIYYIVLETGNKLVSDIISTTNNLDCVDGLLNETCKLEEKYGSNLIILNWKRLKKPFKWLESLKRR